MAGRPILVRRALITGILLVTVGALALVSLGQEAPEGPGDTVTWTGDIDVHEHVAVGSGEELRIEDAHVTFHTEQGDHFGISVEPGGNLTIRNATLENQGSSDENPSERALRYYTIESAGRVDIEGLEAYFGESINLGHLRGAPAGENSYPSLEGSTIKNATIGYMNAQGVIIERGNVSGSPGPQLTVSNVTVHDNYGRDASFPAGLYAMGSNLEAQGLRLVNNSGFASLYLDRSSISRESGTMGSTGIFEDLTVVSGPPRGAAGASLSTFLSNGAGSFHCQGCTFIGSPTGGAFNAVVVNHVEGGATFDDAEFIHTQAFFQPEIPSPLTVTNSTLVGPDSGIHVARNAGDDGAFTVRNSSILTTPITNRVDTQADVRNNWWGHETGPLNQAPADGSLPSTNEGLGVPLSGPFDFRDWLTEPPTPQRPLQIDVQNPPDAYPGDEVASSITVTNHGEDPQAVALSTNAVAPVTLEPDTLDLPPGGSATVNVTATVHEAVHPGASIAVPILADTPRTLTGSVLVFDVLNPNPQVSIEDPLPLDAVHGAFTVQGLVHEPDTPGTGSGEDEQAAAGSQRLGSLDQDGDRIDDRLSGATGPVPTLVLHEGADAQAIADVLDDNGALGHAAFSLVDATWALLPGSALDDVASADEVDAVLFDEPMQPDLAVDARATKARTSLNATLPGGHSPTVSYEGAWSGNPYEGYEGVTGEGALIAVMDSGIDDTHASLKTNDYDLDEGTPKIKHRAYAAQQLLTRAFNVTLETPTEPGPHGTAVAGTAAGTGATYLGHPEAPIDGNEHDLWMHAGAAPQASLMDVDFVSQPLVDQDLPIGRLAVPSSASYILEGLDTIYNWNQMVPDDERVDIVQISWSAGATLGGHPLERAVDALSDQGVLVVVSAGNNFPAVAPPGSAPSALAVGATDTQDAVDRTHHEPASFSSASNPAQQRHGIHKPEIMAPGVDVDAPAHLTGNGYEPISGTSFSAPLASGAAALVMDANPDLPAPQVKEILIKSSENRGHADGSRYADPLLDSEPIVPGLGWDEDWGYGYLDAQNAVRLAETMDPRVPPTLTDTETLLHVDDQALSPSRPDAPGVALLPETFTWTPDEDTAFGDKDPHTNDLALLYLDVPQHEPPASWWTYDVELRVDGETVATSEYSRSTPVNHPQYTVRVIVPLVLGADVSGSINTVQVPTYPHIDEHLDVLDEDGVLQIPAGSTVELEVNASSLGLVDGFLDDDQNDAASQLDRPIALTGRDGSHLALPTDPSTLPDQHGPGAVPMIDAVANATHATLDWAPAPDDRGILEYEIERDSEPIATVPGYETTYTDTLPTEEATPTYTITATDLHENQGPPSEPARVTAPPSTERSIVVYAGDDVIAASDLSGDGTYHEWDANVNVTRLGSQPLTAILYQDGDAIDQDRLHVQIQDPANLPPELSLDVGPLPLHGERLIPVHASDPTGPDDEIKIHYRLNDGAWKLAGDRGISLDARQAGAGEHTLHARATDAAGETSTVTTTITSQPWDATLTAPGLVQPGQDVTVTLNLDGDQAHTANPTLAVDGVLEDSLEMAPLEEETAWTATVPTNDEGTLDLQATHGPDTLADATTAVSSPPSTNVLIFPEHPTRLDPIKLADASTDAHLITERRWTLPNGTTHHGPILKIPPGDLDVGTHEILLNVTNELDQTASTTVPLTVHNLPPKIDAKPPHVLGHDDPINTVLTGETVTIPYQVTSPEGDPLAVEATLQSPKASTTTTDASGTLTLTPTTEGPLHLTITATDPWDETTHTMETPIQTNQPPTATLTAPDETDAHKEVTIDTTDSHDPDRALTRTTLTIQNETTTLATTEDPQLTTKLPLGTWEATLTVEDTSQATATTTHTIHATEWLQAHAELTRTPTLTDQGLAGVTAYWFDDPHQLAKGATATATVEHDLFPGLTTRTVHANLPQGIAWVPFGFDLQAVNLPGPHTAVIEITHPPLPGSPANEDSSDVVEFTFDV